MDEGLWRFVDAMGTWGNATYGLPQTTGRVLGWLLVCDPPEQTAAQIGEALGASAGSISGATKMLVGMKLVERIHIRGERADRFRIRPGAWDDQVRDQGIADTRALIAIGLEALEDESAVRRARLEELDTFYSWWQGRMEAIYEEWLEYKRARAREEAKSRGRHRS